MAHGDITHIEIPVKDMGRARTFYSTLFEWQIHETPGYEGYPMWRAPNGISGGALTERSADFTQPRSFVEVDSIEDVLMRTPDAGGSVLVEKQPISDTSWWAVIADPDGNEIGLYENADPMTEQG